MKQLPKNRLALQVSGIIATMAAALPPTVLAQQESRVLEEVMVTAQKRSESVQDVPIAVTAYGQEFLTNVAATTITDILPYTPGLSGHTAGGTDPVFAIRGISTNAFGNASSFCSGM